MTFEQWFSTLDNAYDSYEDLLRECWEEAQKSKETAA